MALLVVGLARTESARNCLDSNRLSWKIPPGGGRARRVQRTWSQIPFPGREGGSEGEREGGGHPPDSRSGPAVLKEFAMRMKLLYEWTIEQCNMRWQERLEDPAFHKVKQNGHWLCYHFKGVTRTVGTGISVSFGLGVGDGEGCRYVNGWSGSPFGRGCPQKSFDENLVFLAGR